MLGLTGKYRLDRRLGGGGMAEVFIGSTVGAEGFSRKVAIKRVLPGFSENPQFAQMFISEAQLSSRLQHPNIVSVLDFDRDEEARLFLVMELIEGHDLDALIRTGLLPLPVVIYVIAEVLRGLGYAHEGPSEGTPGLIHRDVSPHNVLLSWDGSVKVSDFGIAKARTASNATASVFIKGKPAYMSPEQANGSPLDGRSDLFAVGIMLWELIVGNRLFVAEDTRGTLAKVLFAQIPTPAEHRADVPPDLNAITMKLLDRDLDARYPACEDALDDLMACHDAPRAGRDELAALMSARFPSDAPARTRRQSLPGGGVRAPMVGAGSEPARRSPALGVPSFIPTAPLTPSEPIAVPTLRPAAAVLPSGTLAGVPSAADLTPPMPDSAPVPVYASVPIPMTLSPSPPAALSALRSAPTRTMAASDEVPVAARSVIAVPNSTPRSAGRLLALGLVVAAGVGIVLFLALRTTRSAPTPGAGAASSLVASSTAIDARPATADAVHAVSGVVVLASPPDATPPAPAPPPDATPTTTTDAGSLVAVGSAAASSATPVTGGARRGEIRVSVEPWAFVSINGGVRGDTPYVRKVAPGKYSVRIWNDDLGKAVTKSVTVEPGQTERINLTW